MANMFLFVTAHIGPELKKMVTVRAYKLKVANCLVIYVIEMALRGGRIVILPRALNVKSDDIQTTQVNSGRIYDSLKVAICLVIRVALMASKRC